MGEKLEEIEMELKEYKGKTEKLERKIKEMEGSRAQLVLGQMASNIDKMIACDVLHRSFVRTIILKADCCMMVFIRRGSERPPRPLACGKASHRVLRWWGGLCCPIRWWLLETSP